MPNTTFIIQNQAQKCYLYFLDSQNLYWSNEGKGEKTTFTIQPEDEFLYQCFHNLFDRIKANDSNITANPILADGKRLEKENQYDRSTQTLTFISESRKHRSKEERSHLIIRELEDHYQLTLYNPAYQTHPYCFIQINLAEEKADPLKKALIKFYQDLSIYEINYQFTLDDYIDQAKIKQYKKS